MDYQEFKKRICKARTKKTAKVRGSWGVYDAYKFIRRNGWFDIGKPIVEHDFYSIIREVNKIFAEELSKGNTVVFPERMGKLELRKTIRGAFFENGKLKVTYPVDWRSTTELWYNDEEAFKDKTLVRFEDKESFRVKYVRRDATYENKVFYQFVLNRFIKKALKENIKAGKIDTLYGK